MRPSSLVALSGDEAAPRMYFIPFPTPGHALPMSDLAHLFASRGADAARANAARANATRLGGPVARAAAAGLRIRIHALTLPAEAAGLWVGTRAPTTSPPASSRALLPSPLTLFECSVLCCSTARTPQDGVASDTEPFLVPGLPDAVWLTRSRLAEATLPGAHSREFLNRMFDVERATARWVVNSFEDLQLEIPQKVGRLVNMQRLVLAVGSLSNLQQLFISQNSLLCLPTSVGDLRNMLLLDVSDNKLKALPESIGCCSSLEELQANGKFISF
ncbi:abscisate beta-glucosyltransferase-like [Phragmites australis]|uniref:abscisate beta-glucosyltransferase-like n=1 Tax=Phragmites australis TaxID=29695 RepID=UPI002D7970EA|nr:abscisate beta-glucosyltransferase-like [Phragmites australis]